VIDILFLWINLIVSIFVWILVYYYSFKTYGIKVTLITNLLVSFFVLIQIFTGIYSIADLYLTSYLKATIGTTEFLITDPMGIFPSFMVMFELGRFTLRKTRSKELSVKDIIFVSILVSFYGICHQPIIDLTAAAVGHYYYRNPPELNVFGYPIIFLFSFSIYGLFAFIFLMIERYYKLINKNRSIY
jgi:hypothetical protein